MSGMHLEALQRREAQRFVLWAKMPAGRQARVLLLTLVVSPSFRSYVPKLFAAVRPSLASLTCKEASCVDFGTNSITSFARGSTKLRLPFGRVCVFLPLPGTHILHSGRVFYFFISYLVAGRGVAAAATNSSSSRILPALLLFMGIPSAMVLYIVVAVALAENSVHHIVLLRDKGQMARKRKQGSRVQRNPLSPGADSVL